MTRRPYLPAMILITPRAYLRPAADQRTALREKARRFFTRSPQPAGKGLPD
jgi:hypothetical protein